MVFSTHYYSLMLVRGIKCRTPAVCKNMENKEMVSVPLNVRCIRENWKLGDDEIHV